MPTITLRPRDSTATCAARVPRTYRVLRRLGDTHSLSGAAFLSLPTALPNTPPNLPLLRKSLVVVKVPNGHTYRNTRNNHTQTSDAVLWQECTNSRNLVPHPRFVRIRDIQPQGIPNTRPWIVMDAIAGQSLDTYYEDRNRASVALVWHVCLQLAEAVLWLHHGVTSTRGNARPKMQPSVHCDIRGPNVFLCPPRNQTLAIGSAHNLPGVTLIDLGASLIRPLIEEDAANPTPQPSNRAFMRDFRGLVTAVHALAHDQDPCDPWPWDGVCNCGNVGEYGDFGTGDVMFNDLWDVLVEGLNDADDDERKKVLLGVIRGARRRRDEALRREREVGRLVGDAELLGVLGARCGRELAGLGEVVGSVGEKRTRSGLVRAG